jgi:LPXTG-motif cell wall-anchored protein
MAVAAVMLLSAGVALAQITEYEIKQGTVVSVWGNHLVVEMADGTVKDVEVPDGFTFDVNGKMLPVTALKPGMELTALIKTTSTPVDVYTTEVKHGEVMAVSGRSVIIRHEDGKARKHTVDGDFPFLVNGEEKTVYDLKSGMKVTATIVSSHVEMVTDRDVQVMASGGAPAPKPKARPAPAPAPAAAPATLPKTGSTLPLVGFAGIALLLIGIGLAVIRRF